MSDLLGEALAAFTIDPVMAPPWARSEVLAAARAWHTLSAYPIIEIENGRYQVIKQRASGLARGRYLLVPVDALSVTPTPEEGASRQGDTP